MRALTGLFSILLATCAKPGAGATTSTGGSGTASSDTAQGDACQPAALGLAAAQPVAAWQAPAGCELKTLSGAGPLLLRSEAELADHVVCTGLARHGLDLTRQTLVTVRRTLSPAGMGTSVLDDGKTITFVSRFRKNCPGDPMPMPMNYALSFVLPAGAERDFKEASCTLDTNCP